EDAENENQARSGEALQSHWQRPREAQPRLPAPHSHHQVPQEEAPTPPWRHGGAGQRTGGQELAPVSLKESSERTTMPRAKRGTKLRRRHKKLLKLAKGVIGGRKNYRQARSTVEKALVYAYRDRKARKRDFRSLWIVRINAAARLKG